MENSNYTLLLTVDASAETVFNSINDISGWWTENVEGQLQRTGDEFNVTFGTTAKKFRVVASEPFKKVTWLVTDSYMPWNSNQSEWTGTEIIFDIDQDNGKTYIRFTHKGLVAAFACFDACTNA